MCRNIKPLFNFDPPTTQEEIREASLQFIRKLSGFSKPSKVNEASFSRAVEEVALAARSLLDSLVTAAAPRNREVEALRARAKAVERFGPSRNGLVPGSSRSRGASLARHRAAELGDSEGRGLLRGREFLEPSKKATSPKVQDR